MPLLGVSIQLSALDQRRGLRMLRMVAKMDIKESPTRIIWVRDQRWSEVRKVKPKNTKRVKTTKQ